MMNDYNIILLVNAIICCSGMFFMGTIILNKKIKEIKWYNYLFILLSSLFMMCSSILFDNVFKIFGIILTIFLTYRVVYKVDISVCLLTTLISYIILALTEALLMLVIGLFDIIFSSISLNDIITPFIGNTLIVIASLGFTMLLAKRIRNWLFKIKKSNSIYIIIIGIITIIIIASSLYKTYFSIKSELTYSFILNIIIITGCVTLAIFLIKEYIKNKEIVEKYKLHSDYLKTSAELIGKYSTTIHKYKNNLISIKGYIKSDVNKANEYVDSLLEIYNDKNYSWFPKIENIPIDVIKYMLYYKLSKAEYNKLNLSVTISKELKNQKYEELTIQEIGVLTDIIGEYLDNAIYASNESTKKELIIDLYIENNNLCLVVSNTFKDDVNLKLITRNGYTTKGKGHGLGLHEVEKLVKQEQKLNTNYEIMDDYFIVKLELSIVDK